MLARGHNAMLHDQRGAGRRAILCVSQQRRPRLTHTTQHDPQTIDTLRQGCHVTPLEGEAEPALSTVFVIVGETLSQVFSRRNPHLHHLHLSSPTYSPTVHQQPLYSTPAALPVRTSSPTPRAALQLYYRKGCKERQACSVCSPLASRPRMCQRSRGATWSCCAQTRPSTR